jgi:hypothetical protein
VLCSTARGTSGFTFPACARKAASSTYRDGGRAYIQMMKRNLRTWHEYQSQPQQLAITTIHTIRYSVTYSWSPWRPYIGLSSSYSSCWCWWWCWWWSLPPGLGGAAGGGEGSSGMGSNGPWVALNLPESKHLAQRSKLGTAA